MEEAIELADYLSQKDIEICAALLIAAEFAIFGNSPSISSLHETLLAKV